MVVSVRIRRRFVLLLLVAFTCLSLRLCFGEDRITFSTPIKDSDSESLLCKSGIFRFGFFTPVNSTTKLRYVGIWYDKIPLQTVVWVANKDTPINDTSGVISISPDNGNLVITAGRNRLLWSTNVTVPVAPNATWVRLMDSGNLMLPDNRNNGGTLWESFKHPYDSFMPRMTLGTNGTTKENLRLTSWRSHDDPSTGNYTAGIAPFTFPELLIWKNNDISWRSGPWNGQVFIGLPNMDSLLFLDGFNLISDSQGTISMSYANDSFMYHFNLDPEGAIYQKDWSTSMKDWRIGVRFPKTDCDAYARCGQYATCQALEKPPCKCVKGFMPRNSTEWNRGNWSNGCERRTLLRCQRQNNESNGGGGGKEDGFVKMQKMKVPISAERSETKEDVCPKVCLDNCSCTAYAYDQGIGCMIWSVSLVDMQSFLGSGTDLYIRVAHSELKTHSNRAIMIAAPVIGVVLIAAVCVLLACRRFRKRPAPVKDRSAEILFKRMEELTSGNESASNQVKLKDLPLFEFQVLATSTDNFSLRNKLGQGGFGPVYKGQLPEGQEIAVKRLSRKSGQGLEELMNEVVVISKLQHRNLVRLLGCCIEGEERLLVYEYMPKKSLDAYLFDPMKQHILDWKTRFNIMEGICRGLLYLHRDSRLKIIHRDLKASNILLDENLNPKISDFGLARVFQGNEDEANTRRVVGTYGYMSPEYAMEGFFSEKSDVFSLGVIFLEIISGRRNSSSFKEEKNLNLLAYAWKLWSDGEAASLADPVVFDKCFEKEIEKCVQIGLLCVQEFSNDRPNVSNVIWMLTTENTNLAQPKQPAFIVRRGVSEAESSDQSSQKASINDVSLTAVTGR
ncbi:G-type lectin S-receptor-like serine/threonine-protein kinase [Cardamine amara subsp. amara]|uniref:Receptor-like serine/threonine-protein kinase n=1 Tax=Cardamine amara subsp. amara TaxID=228776 RepID=A0ABD1C0B7_CARAN